MEATRKEMKEIESKVTEKELIALRKRALEKVESTDKRQVELDALEQKI